MPATADLGRLRTLGFGAARGFGGFLAGMIGVTKVPSSSRPKSGPMVIEFLFEVSMTRVDDMT